MGAGQSTVHEPLLHTPPGADAEHQASAHADGPSSSLVIPAGLPAKISVRDLSLEVGGDTILSGVSLDARSGEVTCLIGPSGSGKSTLLRALNRLWEPARGTVFLDGVDITALKVLTLRRRVGMLLQSPHLFDGTVADNVRYGPALAGRKLSNSEIVGFLQLASLDPSFVDRHVTTLSGGQAQRVALARTLANQPDVLLLDEPTSALDPAATLTVEQSISALRASAGLTVVWVSHSVEQVLRVANTVYLILDGRVRDSFSPSEFDEHPLAKQFAEGRLRSLRSLRAER